MASTGHPAMQAMQWVQFPFHTGLPWASFHVVQGTACRAFPARDARVAHGEPCVVHVEAVEQRVHGAALQPSHERRGFVGEGLARAHQFRQRSDARPRRLDDGLAFARLRRGAERQVVLRHGHLGQPSEREALPLAQPSRVLRRVARAPAAGENEVGVLVARELRRLHPLLHHAGQTPRVRGRDEHEWPFRLERARLPELHQAVDGHEPVPRRLRNLYGRKLAVPRSAEIEDHAIPPLSNVRHTVS